jgi:hypothetical protein
MCVEIIGPYKRLPAGIDTSYYITFRTNIIMRPNIFKLNENKLYSLNDYAPEYAENLVCLQYASVIVFLFICHLFIDTIRSSDFGAYV